MFYIVVLEYLRLVLATFSIKKIIINIFNANSLFFYAPDNFDFLAFSGVKKD